MISIRKCHEKEEARLQADRVRYIIKVSIVLHLPHDAKHIRFKAIPFHACDASLWARSGGGGGMRGFCHALAANVRYFFNVRSSDDRVIVTERKAELQGPENDVLLFSVFAKSRLCVLIRTNSCAECETAREVVEVHACERGRSSSSGGSRASRKRLLALPLEIQAIKHQCWQRFATSLVHRSLPPGVPVQVEDVAGSS